MSFKFVRRSALAIEDLLLNRLNEVIAFLAGVSVGGMGALLLVSLLDELATP